MLGHHQGGVFRKRFGQKLRAFHVGADHLMGPPLVSDLVRRGVPHIVDRAGTGQVGDEAAVLRVGNHRRKRLRRDQRKGVSRKLGDPQLAKRVGPELRRVVGQRLLHGIDHAAPRFDCAWDDGRRRARRRSSVARDRVAARHHRPEIQDRGVDAVAKELATAVAPFALEISRCERNLIGAGRDGNGKVDEIGVGVDEVAPALRLVVPRGHAGQRLEPMGAPARVRLQVELALHPYQRREIGAVRKCAVVEDGAAVAAFLEAALAVGDRESQCSGFARRDRRARAELDRVEPSLPVGHVRVLQIDLVDPVHAEHHQDGFDRRVGAVHQGIAAARTEGPLVGIEIDLHRRCG